MLADRHIVLPLDLRRVRRFGADRRHRRAQGRRRARAFRSPTCRRATRSSSAWRLGLPKRAARGTSSSASMRSIIRAIPTADRSSSRSSSSWRTSRPRPESEGERFTDPCAAAAHDARPTSRWRRSGWGSTRRSATAATIRCPTAAIAATATPAGCAPRVSPRRGSPTRRSTHERSRQTLAPLASTARPRSGRGYAVKECFLTLQGEGAQSGSRAVFLRFAGCNLWSGREAGPGDGASAASAIPISSAPTGRAAASSHSATRWPRMSRALGRGGRSGAWWSITGGEPMLQLDRALVEALHARGFRVAVETNGTLPAVPGLDWICVSPKAGTEVVQRRGNELEAGVAAGRDRTDRARAVGVRPFPRAADGLR